MPRPESDSQRMGRRSPAEDLPLFAYGSLKLGELAYARIEPFLLKRPPEDEAMAGVLYVRDGLPLLQPYSGSKPIVEGSLFRFSKAKAGAAYAEVDRFEPSNQYGWEVRPVLGTAEMANVLVGIEPSKGSVQFEDTTWSWLDDPLFNEGTAWVQKQAASLVRQPFDNPRFAADEWQRLFTIQSVYLFLWSMIERFGYLRYGGHLSVEERVDMFRDDFHGHAAQAAKAMSRELGLPIDVVAATNPRSQHTIGPGDGRQAMSGLRQVRHNLTHRGKGTQLDGERMRKSLALLAEVWERTRAEKPEETERLIASRSSSPE